MRVLGSGPGAVKAAQSLQLERDDLPSPMEASYVAVLEGPGAWAGWRSLVEMGVEPLALVALHVPSAVLARMAPQAPPIVVGIPDQWQLQAALEAGNDAKKTEMWERQARLESYLASASAKGGNN